MKIKYKRWCHTKAKSKLYELREEKGWTDDDLARAAGISKSTVNRIENNRVSPTLDTLVMLSEALNCNISELYYLDKEWCVNRMESFVPYMEQLREIDRFIRKIWYTMEKVAGRNRWRSQTGRSTSGWL